MIEKFTEEDDQEFETLQMKGLENLDENERNRYFQLLAKHRFCMIANNLHQLLGGHEIKETSE